MIASRKLARVPSLPELPALPTVGSLPELPKLTPSQPKIVGTPTELYTRIARGAMTCDGFANPLRKDIGFQSHLNKEVISAVVPSQRDWQLLRIHTFDFTNPGIELNGFKATGRKASRVASSPRPRQVVRV